MDRKFLLIYFVFLVAVFAAAGCATAPRAPSSKIAETSLKEICDRAGITWQSDTVSQVITLKSGTAKAHALLGSNVVLIGDEKIMLSGPVKIVQSAIIVPPDFKEKVIDRLKKALKIPQIDYSIRKGKEIILDPGHGGKDPGAIGKTGLKEKKIVLDIARRLKRILERHGLKVKMTRDTDTFISLPERTEIASRSKADLFVSIHANSHPSRNVSGMEVYALRELGFKEKSEQQRLDNMKTYFRNLSMKQDIPDVEAIVSDMLYDYKRSESEVLASDVADKASRFVQTKNLGMKHAQYFVLRNTLIPAILVEVGFVTNPKEERLLKTLAYREKIAYGIARSLLDYVQVQ